ncbi:hypothetical protein DOY81_010478 [Sarcophaga bullata]|nr:hypothetical protein DOY81_010478 [Sarcophaga bullata]
MDEVNFNDFIKYLIYMEYEITSMNDLPFRFLQLEKCLKNNEKLLNLSKTLNDCINDFNGDFKHILPSLPLNMKLFPRIRDYSVKSIDGRKDEGLCLSFSLLMNMLLKNITQEPVTKLSSISVLTYSQAVAKKALTDRLNNAFVQEFSEFLLQLEKLLKTKMSDIHIDLKDYIQLITAVLWFNRILDVSSLNIYINKEINTDLIDKLILHFKWLNKNLIELIRKIKPNFEKMSPELHDSFNKMTKYITSNQHPLDLRRKLYAEHIMAFQPFYQEEQIQIFTITQKLDELLRLIPVYGQFAIEDINTKIAVRNNELCRKVNIMISKHLNSINFHKIIDINLNHSYGKSLPKEIILKLQHFLSNFANNRPKSYQIPSDDLEMLDQDLNQISVLFEKNQQEEEQKDSSDVHHEIELGLLAIKEYFFVKFLISSIDNPSDNNKLPINHLYIETFNYLNSSIISLISTYELPYYQDYRVFWLDLCNYLNNMESPTDFKDVLIYLNGGYKHLSAMHKVISNLTQRIQLESIKSIECIKINALKDDIQSIYVYNGPPFLKIISNTIFTSEYGAFKTIPLCDIDIWKNLLQQQCEIIWSNSALETLTHNTLWNNYIKAQKNAKRLLLEVNYIEMLCHKQDEVTVTPFTRNFQNLTNKLKDYIVESSSYVKNSSKFDSLENQEVLYKTSLTNALIGCVELCL